MKKIIFLIPLLFWGCASQFAALQNNRQYDIAIEEVRTEVADLKHALHGAEVEIHLLEEKLETPPSKTSELNETLLSLQRKIAILERNQDKLAGDIRSLSNHAHQTTASLSQYREQIQELDIRFEDLNKIKNTLSSISKSMGGSKTTYRVKPNDSLEKIAREYQVSIKALKQLNNLTNDTIKVDQELIIPNG